MILQPITDRNFLFIYIKDQFSNLIENVNRAIQLSYTEEEIAIIEPFLIAFPQNNDNSFPINLGFEEKMNQLESLYNECTTKYAEKFETLKKQIPNIIQMENIICQNRRFLSNYHNMINEIKDKYEKCLTEINMDLLKSIPTLNE